jgi:predicted lipoprotein with Yx(FWY)xxD motif
MRRELAASARVRHRQASSIWAIIARDDDKKIWAYKRQPLYALKNGKAPGGADGDGKLNGA